MQRPFVVFVGKEKILGISTCGKKSELGKHAQLYLLGFLRSIVVSPFRYRVRERSARFIISCGSKFLVCVEAARSTQRIEFTLYFHIIRSNDDTLDLSQTAVS